MIRSAGPLNRGAVVPFAKAKPDRARPLRKRPVAA